jgi:inner membrane protein
VDTLTHALSGALLARAAAPLARASSALTPRQRLAAGLAGGLFPDIDFAARAGGTLWYLAEIHQGPTHSLVLLPLWALALAWLFQKASGQRWQAWYAPVALGIGIHIAGDLVTAYGTMLLWPLSDWRPALAWTFVIDPWFTLIVVAGLAAARRWPRRGAALAALALAALAGYVGFQGMLQQRAGQLAEAHARAQRLDGATGHALAQPFSPFHWQLIVRHGEEWHVGHARLAAGRSLVELAPVVPLFARMASRYRAAPEWTVETRFGSTKAEIALAREAWRQEALREFRRFAAFPAMRGVAADGARECAWFLDLRFALPELPPSFVFGACRAGASSPWELERRRGALWID